MKPAIQIITIVTAFLWLSVSGRAQAISPPVTRDFPFQVGIMMDGGSFYVIERGLKNAPNIFCFDHKIDSETHGELYASASPMDSLTTGKLVPPKDAKQVFARWRKALTTHYGADEL